MAGLRITTWNVNGIRNPFSYQPWRDNRSFNAMFDILQADIVVMQELKIQRKDLRDDMVLIPGWDCFFSLPKHKKGYSGVGIYTRNAVCAPIRAEEGLLGVLNHPTAQVPYCDLPADESIGGYLSASQIDSLGIDPVSIDAEGRCVVLEFPAFVLLGVYSPANSNGLRDDFRYAFVSALDTRIRNLTAAGKRVILTGDLNVSRSEIDTAHAEESLRKEGLTHEEYISTPNRRIFNQLLEGGEVVGQRDEGREKPILWDTTREFHPRRTGMYTHWEQKINARPANFGSRIDYILVSTSLKDWVLDANIQEGLMGSDHCPVYATFKKKVSVNGKIVDLLDMMNPDGMFSFGVRIREYTSRDILAFSGRRLEEFTNRRSIKDMFARKPPQLEADTESNPATAQSSNGRPVDSESSGFNSLGLTKGSPISPSNSQKPTVPSTLKRASSSASKTSPKPLKRTKASISHAKVSVRLSGQQTLQSFFKPPTRKIVGTGMLVPATLVQNEVPERSAEGDLVDPKETASPESVLPPDIVSTTPAMAKDSTTLSESHSRSPGKTPSSTAASNGIPVQAELGDAEVFVDPIASKESWSKLFSKPVPPRCEGHDEPCIFLTTKKAGFNCGRSFWICPRPVGPSGGKEKGTEWRCHTFIWASDRTTAKPTTSDELVADAD